VIPELASPHRRRFLAGMAAATTALMLPPLATSAFADPRGNPDGDWVANFENTLLEGADGKPVAWLPKFTRMRVLRGFPDVVEVWVPRHGIVGRIPANQIGPVAAPSPTDLVIEKEETSLPGFMGVVGLPGRVVGSGTLRLWPSPANANVLRRLGHNAPVRVLSRIEGEDHEEWLHVHLLADDGFNPIGSGFIHHSTVRIPKGILPATPDRAQLTGKFFQADLSEPTMLMAYEDGAPIWATLAVRGAGKDRTPLGYYRILRRVANETMTSETWSPPIPRDAPGGYFVKDVLYTQYFSWGGEALHYNYWNSSFGYQGSRGCLGLNMSDSRFCWDWGEIGTPVHIFAS
jgi:hypothetical protein